MDTELSHYQYTLPPELIAQSPLASRDASRLLVVDRATQTIRHRSFRDLPEYFGPTDLLVANNTQVIRARLVGQRILPEGKLGGKVEMLLLECQADGSWVGAFHSSARQVPGLRFRVPTPDGSFIEGELTAGAADSDSGTVVARFDRDPIRAGAGELPLPHYIERNVPDAGDTARYQTVYAKEEGSAAAPTAGLHFTDSVLEQLRERGAGWEEITLHVGLGTFRPVKVSDIRDHVMHEERYAIADEASAKITSARTNGKRITAVGTTSVRTLESAWDPERARLRSGPGRTQIFIYPGGREFRVVDRLITNFHLPGSTLLMLVCAFAGSELTMEAYRQAVKERYRFFSYGDAMLIL